MTGHDDLLVRLARAVATTPIEHALSERLCMACRDLAGADAAALSMTYDSNDRMTLFATDDLAAQLEELQDVFGEGPAHTAAHTGAVAVCHVSEGSSSPWPHFAVAAQERVGAATVHAVPMMPDGETIGVMTLYQGDHGEDRPLALPQDTLTRLAAATAAALVRDPDATAEEVERGPWQSRARIHQATGMVVAQLAMPPDDALAVLKAHAYAADTTLEDVASRVLSRTLRFHPPTDRGR
jgi:hypothetical protein